MNGKLPFRQLKGTEEDVPEEDMMQPQYGQQNAYQQQQVQYQQQQQHHHHQPQQQQQQQAWQPPPVALPPQPYGLPPGHHHQQQQHAGHHQGFGHGGGHHDPHHVKQLQMHMAKLRNQVESGLSSADAKNRRVEDLLAEKMSTVKYSMMSMGGALVLLLLFVFFVKGRKPV